MNKPINNNSSAEFAIFDHPFDIEVFNGYHVKGFGQGVGQVMQGDLSLFSNTKVEFLHLELGFRSMV